MKKLPYLSEPPNVWHGTHYLTYCSFRRGKLFRLREYFADRVKRRIGFNMLRELLLYFLCIKSYVARMVFDNSSRNRSIVFLSYTEYQNSIEKRERP